MSAGSRDRSPASGAGHDIYVHDVLDLLWPARNATVAGAEPTTTLLVLPPGEPRLVVPSEPARVAAAALRGYNTALSGPARARHALGALALRLGAGRMLLGRVGTEAGTARGSIESALSGILGRRVWVSVYLGPPRVGQKPVLQLLSERGETVGFAKLGVGAHSNALIAHEADALRQLAAARLPHLEVPIVLHDGLWAGHRLLVQSALGASRGRRGSGRLRAVAGLEVAGAWGTTRTEVGSSVFAERLRSRVSTLREGPIGDYLRTAVDRATQRTGDRVLSMGATHGDWCPWNMTPAGDRLRVWDWEGLGHDVPLGVDGLHYEVNRSVALAHRPPERVLRQLDADAPGILALWGVGAADARLTALWYVLDLAASYAARGEDRLGGTALSRLERWLVPVVESMLAGRRPPPR